MSKTAQVKIEVDARPFREICERMAAELRRMRLELLLHGRTKALSSRYTVGAAEARRDRRLHR